MANISISKAALEAVAMQRPGVAKAAAGGEEFGTALKEALGKVTEIHKEAEQAVQQLQGGGDIAEAMIAMEKADLSFQVMLEVRNKLLSAYQEIMRMQV